MPILVRLNFLIATEPPVHPIRTFGRKQFIHVTLAVAHTHKPGFGTTRPERSKVPDAFDPFDALFLCDRSRFAVASLAGLFLRSHPGLHAQHAQWQTFGGHSQQTVHHEPALIAAGTIAQSLSRVQMRQVKFGRVLDRQHHRHLTHAIQRLRNVWCQNAVGIDLCIVKEPVRGLQFGGLERLWKRPLRTAGKPARQRNQTLRQTRVAQIRIAELGACPVVRVVLVDQSRMPLQTGWAEVNIDPIRLQAKTDTVTYRLVGNPENFRGGCAI
jgi:hypothetical protein